MNNLEKMHGFEKIRVFKKMQGFENMHGFEKIRVF